MKPKRHQAIKLPNNGCQLQQTRYGAGDFIRRGLQDTRILPSTTYRTRHIFFDAWRLEFPGGAADEHLDGVTVWPQADIEAPRGFKWTAEAAGAMYYCIVPGSGKAVSWERHDLAAGQALDIPAPRIAIVAGTAWTLNGEAQTRARAVACELQPARIEGPATVFVFTTRNEP